ncbi:MAG: mechanosensitive ion channel [Myxococcales bacterium]|nr:mechanosensitive ion channel [Myxococcales bacterium]
MIEILPTAGLFLAVIVGGLILSAIARRTARWAVDKSGLDGLAEKAGAARLLYAIGIRKGVAHLVGSLVWFAGLLVTAAAAADVLGLEAVSDGAAALIAFLPRLAAAGLVLGAGAALAGLLRRIAVGFGARREDVEQPELLGNLAYYGVMTLSVVVAAHQAGIETALVETLLVTFATVTAAAIALAFALGSRHSFHNLVAGHFLRRLARPGDTIKVGDVEGVVVRYFGVSVILRTRSGEVAVPCKVLLDNNVGLGRLGAKERSRLEAEGDEGEGL